MWRCQETFRVVAYSPTHWEERTPTIISPSQHFGFYCCMTLWPWPLIFWPLSIVMYCTLHDKFFHQFEWPKFIAMFDIIVLHFFTVFKTKYYRWILLSSFSVQIIFIVVTLSQLPLSWHIVHLKWNCSVARMCICMFQRWVIEVFVARTLLTLSALMDIQIMLETSVSSQMHC